MSAELQGTTRRIGDSAGESPTRAARKYPKIPNIDVLAFRRALATRLHEP